MRILLVCNNGMSSSILVKKMIAAAEHRKLQVTIEARPNADLRDEIGKWDVCLLGPQIMYAVNTVNATLGIPVASIETRVYALADGDKALDQALSLASANS